jgi:hypothetical protein
MSVRTIEPTADERRNGWTEESLAQYRGEMQRIEREMVFTDSSKQPARANSKYRPHRWRG